LADSPTGPDVRSRLGTPGRLWATAALVVTALVMLGMLIVAGMSSMDNAAQSGGLAPAPGATATATPGTDPSTGASASAGRPLVGATPGSVSHGSAAAYVQPFAAGLSASPQGPLPKPTAPVTVSANIDGCDHSYGTISQCVPWEFPAGVTDKCAWLRAHGFGPLAVHGRDRQHLDTNGDGTACGPNDD
jgi:hypothetical protein